MSRWIEIDTALLKTVSVGGLSAKALWKRIMQQPSIDIVRCKECIHNPWNVRCDYTCVWDDDFADRPQTPDDFCSYGEREDE